LRPKDITIIDFGALHEIRQPGLLSVAQLEDGALDEIGIALVGFYAVLIDQRQRFLITVFAEQPASQGHDLVAGVVVGVSPERRTSLGSADQVQKISMPRKASL
jgi:hypothetical protein